jgi:hypothetical protein
MLIHALLIAKQKKGTVPQTKMGKGKNSHELKGREGRLAVATRKKVVCVADAKKG